MAVMEGGLGITNCTLKKYHPYLNFIPVYNNVRRCLTTYL